ncbi:MAG: DUF4292 domain-containing protein [Bacteroidia bacterium]
MSISGLIAQPGHIDSSKLKEVYYLDQTQPSEVPSYPVIMESSLPDSEPEAAATWEYMSGRYDVSTALGGQDMALTLSVRMRRDSLVWFSVQAALGIQVAKGLLRQDSLFLLDLYNRKYYSMPSSRMPEVMGFSLPLSALQELLMNQRSAFGPCDCIAGLVEAKPGDSLIRTQYRGLPVSYRAGYVNDCYWEDENLAYRARSAPWKGSSEERTLTHCASLCDREETWKMTWAYDEFSEGDGLNLPLSIHLLGGETKGSAQNIVQASMRLKTARFTPIPSYPFAVPEDYERVAY